ncbi:hypothetical protein KW433_23480, partial [Enterobacter kobei]
EWVHVQLHQQKGMISLSPPTICNSAPSEIFTSDIIMHIKEPGRAPQDLLVGGHAVLDALSSLPGAEVEVDLLSLIDGLDDELVKHYGGAQAAQKNHKRD